MQNAIDKFKAEVRKELGVQSNADRIRSFSDEELAEFLANFAWDNEPTKKETYEWLQSEVEELNGY